MENPYYYSNSSNIFCAPYIVTPPTTTNYVQHQQQTPTTISNEIMYPNPAYLQQQQHYGLPITMTPNDIYYQQQQYSSSASATPPPTTNATATSCYFADEASQILPTSKHNFQQPTFVVSENTDTASLKNKAPTKKMKKIPDDKASNNFTQNDTTSTLTAPVSAATRRRQNRISVAVERRGGRPLHMPAPEKLLRRRVSANKKERRRTMSINGAFTQLRSRIPNVPNDTKLSKIKTLRLASSYIAYLTAILNGDHDNNSTSQTSTSPSGGFETIIADVLRAQEDSRKRMRRTTTACRTGWPQHVWAGELNKPPVTATASSFSAQQQKQHSAAESNDKDLIFNSNNKSKRSAMAGKPQSTNNYSAQPSSSSTLCNANQSINMSFPPPQTATTFNSSYTTTECDWNTDIASNNSALIMSGRSNNIHNLVQRKRQRPAEMLKIEPLSPNKQQQHQQSISSQANNCHQLAYA